MPGVSRTDRLHALYEELRRRGPDGATGPELAERFGVSIRTITRDLATLQRTGAPIVAQPGPGGGYALDTSATLPPVSLAPAQGVAVAVALAALPPGSPFAADAAAARDKVWDALGPGERARAAALSQRVRVGSGDGRGAADDGASPVVLRAAEDALARSRVLLVTHRPASAAPPARFLVEPTLLAHARDRWWLVGWKRSGLPQEPGRWVWLPLAEIRAAHVTAEAFAPRPVADVGDPPDA